MSDASGEQAPDLGLPIDRFEVDEILRISDDGEKLGALLEYSLLTAERFAEDDPFRTLGPFMPEDLKSWAKENLTRVIDLLTSSDKDPAKEHYYIVRDTGKFEGSAWLERVQLLRKAYSLSFEMRVARLAVRLLYLEAESRLADHTKMIAAGKAAKVATQASAETNEPAA